MPLRKAKSFLELTEEEVAGMDDKQLAQSFLRAYQESITKMCDQVGMRTPIMRRFSAATKMAAAFPLKSYIEVYYFDGDSARQLVDEIKKGK